jgi:uncharacterized protein (DUF362 family)
MLLLRLCGHDRSDSGKKEEARLMTAKKGCNDGAHPKGISRREILRLAAMTGLLAGCRSLVETVIPPGTPAASATSAPAPTDTSTIAPAASATPTATPAASPTATASPAPTTTPSASPTPIATSVPTPINEAETVPVSFVKTTDRSEGVRKAIDLLGINPVEGKSVLLKPNFNSADPAPGSTHPDVLRALVLKLKEMGAQSITVGDRSGMGVTHSVMEKLGVFELAGELGFQVIDFDQLHEASDWVIIEPPDSHWKQGFPFARPCLDAEAIVQACCLKTHQFGGHFTMSLKNSVGMVARSIPNNPARFMDELHGSRHQRAMIAEINAAYTPALIVLDGVEAFTTGGPATGKLVSSEVILAGTDRIAIDAVGVALLRHFHTKPQVARGPIFQ